LILDTADLSVDLVELRIDSGEARRRAGSQPSDAGSQLGDLGSQLGDLSTDRLVANFCRQGGEVVALLGDGIDQRVCGGGQLLEIGRKAGHDLGQVQELLCQQLASHGHAKAIVASQGVKESVALGSFIRAIVPPRLFVLRRGVSHASL